AVSVPAHDRARPCVLTRENARDPAAQLPRLDEDPVPGAAPFLGAGGRHSWRRDRHGSADPAHELSAAVERHGARRAARVVHVGAGRAPVGRDGSRDAPRRGARRRVADPSADSRRIRSRHQLRVVRGSLGARRLRALCAGPADRAAGRDRPARRARALRRRALLAVPRVDPGGARKRDPRRDRDPRGPPGARVMTDAARTGRASLFVLGAAAFMVQTDARVIDPLLHVVATDFHTTPPAAAIIISSYALPYGLFQLLYGPIGDRVGKLRVMATCLAVFSIGTFACAFVPTIPVFAILRFLTGVVAAAVIPMSLGYIGDKVPYQDRQIALGRFMSALMIGQIVGSTVGGLFGQYLGWRYVFVVLGVCALGVSGLLAREG